MLLSAAIGLLTFTAAAQTNLPPAPPIPTSTTLPGTVLDYLTSFNTNLDTTFKDNSFDLWVGASSIQGASVPIVNDLGLSFDLWRPTPANTNSTDWTALGVEFVERNGGVTGTVLSTQLGLDFSVVIHDTKLSVYGDGGYNIAKGYITDSNGKDERFYGEFGFRAKKAVGPHFFLGVGMGFQVPKSAQVFSGFAGATF